jgi:hypothetical protein
VGGAALLRAGGASIAKDPTGSTGAPFHEAFKDRRIPNPIHHLKKTR